jgi:hypothetical protein
MRAEERSSPDSAQLQLKHTDILYPMTPSVPTTVTGTNLVTRWQRFQVQRKRVVIIKNAQSSRQIASGFRKESLQYEKLNASLCKVFLKSSAFISMQHNAARH